MPALSNWSSSDGFVMVWTVLPHVLIIEGLVLEGITVRVPLPANDEIATAGRPLLAKSAQPNPWTAAL